MKPTSSLLLAEDDAELRRLFRSALEVDGHSVTEARNGAELLDRVATRLMSEGTRESFDLVVSDIRMPGWTGLEILHHLRAAGDHVPWLLVSAFVDERTRSESSRLGAVLLEKPIDLHTFRAAVRALSAPVSGHVLLAEDDDRLRELVATLLRDAGFEVTENANGLELVASVRARTADLTRPIAIVTDVRMPLLSGLGALEQLGALASVPTVVMTGSPTPDVRERASRLGATVIEKPDVPHQLVGTLRALFARRSALHE